MTTITIVANPEVNWLAKIFCFGCQDLLIPDNTYGWECLTCGGTLRMEVDPDEVNVIVKIGPRWRWREAGFYE